LNLPEGRQREFRPDPGPGLIAYRLGVQYRRGPSR
jgi:hypothetical protein